MKRDNLHFRWNKVLSYNKTWNFAVGERESGKSVDSWFLLWNAYHYDKRPSVVFRRRIADMTSTYIDDIENVLNKFLNTKVQMVYLKGDVKQGIVDVKLGEAGVTYTPAQIKKMPVFVRIIGLSNPMNRIKSLMLPNVKYFFFDEFIANLRGGEKYLAADEYFLIQEVYTTYNREAKTPIRIICAGNPYSVYTPLFLGLGVDSSRLKPGSFIVGDNYCIDCFQTPDELKKIILKNNPMYQFDDSYKRYAFSGESINDQNIRIIKCEPKGFKLKYVLKFGNDYVSIHKGTGTNEDGEFKYWCCKHKTDWLQKISKNRKVICFNFKDMIAGTEKFNEDQMDEFARIHIAMDKRQITYNCIDISYMLEDIYGVI